jgi:hypothetical protein
VTAAVDATVRTGGDQWDDVRGQTLQVVARRIASTGYRSALRLSRARIFGWLVDALQEVSRLTVRIGKG